MWDNFSQPNTYQETMLVLFSLTYNAYDLLACTYHKLIDKGLIIHHTTSIYCVGTAYFTGYTAIYNVGGFLPNHLLLECNSPVFWETIT